MKRTATVTCVGEVIVDFVATDSGSQLGDAKQFLKAAGGAPANVAVGLARLGTAAAFIGTVGDDPFGRFLAAFLHSEGVDVSGVRFDRQRKTRLAFVSLTDSGERDFAFWESRPADEDLRLTAADYRKISLSGIVHISSFMLLNKTSRTTVMRLAKRLRTAGTKTSFDPNVRLSLWRSPHEARSTLNEMIGLCNIVKMNTEEAFFITGKRSAELAGADLLRRGPDLAVITAGKKGCSFYTRKGSGNVHGFDVQPVDTTGCGDAFLAALLHKLSSAGASVPGIDLEILTASCRYANAVGALAAKEYGAMTVPPPVIVEEFLKVQ